MKSEKTTRISRQSNPFLTRKSFALPLLALLSITSMSAQQVTLLNDNFTNAVRVESPANVFTGVDWNGVAPLTNDYTIAYNNTSAPQARTNAVAPKVASSGGINGNSLAIGSGAVAVSLSTYFAPATLGVGDSISVSLNIRTSAAPSALATTFRIGLFDSNGGGNLVQNTTYIDSAFTDDRGYAAFFGTGAAVTHDVRERTATALQNIFRPTDFTLVGTAVTATNSLLANTNYPVTLNITRSLDGLSMTTTGTFNGVTVSAKDVAALVTDFDHLAIQFGSQFGGTEWIDDVVVTYTPAPPVLLAYYPFDNGFNDASGKNNHLIMSSGSPGITNTLGQIMVGGGALNLNQSGTQQHLRFTTPLDFDGTRAWSMAWWGKRSASGLTSQGMIAGTITDSNDFVWTPNAAGVVQGLRLRNGSAVNADYNSIPDDNAFHHWAVSYNGAGQVTVWRDNVALGTKAFSGDVNMTHVGAGTNSSTHSFFGQIDDLSFYDGAINAAKVNELYTTPSGTEGFLLCERWHGIIGNDMSALFDAPEFKEAPLVGRVTEARTPSNLTDSYGIRIRGTLKAPASGQYRFYISSKDQGELWLGSTADRFSRRKVALVEDSTSPLQWDKYTAQASAWVTMEAGQHYWIEALMKAGNGEDHLAIGWVRPGETAIEIIPGAMPDGTAVLHTPATTTEDLDDDGLPDAWETTVGLNPADNGRINGADGGYSDWDGDGFTNFEEWQTGGNPLEWGGNNGVIRRDVWTGIFGNTVADLTKHVNFPKNANSSTWEQPATLSFASRGASYGQRLTGCIVPPYSGNWRFWIASDNASELWLSSNASRLNKTKVASVLSSAESYAFDATPSQRSVLVPLAGGQPYFYEVLHKEESGGGHVSAAWNFESTNWALGATASQSSVASGGSAQRAIDGNTSGVWTANSITRTNDAANSWWQVDFNAPRPVNRVVLWNRTDPGMESRLSNFRIAVTKPDGSVVFKDFFPTGQGNVVNSLTWDLDSVVQASRIRVSLNGINNAGNGVLSLAEFQAFEWHPETTRQVIPASALRSQYAEPLDLDGDSLPDAWESQFGLSPTDNGAILAANGEHGDLDGDGISNFDEYQRGTSPAIKNTLTDGLTRERWLEISGSNITDLTGNRARFLRQPNERLHVPGINDSFDDDNMASRYRGAITAPVSGDYTFWISGDNQAELWFSDGSVQKNLAGIPTPLTNRYGKQRLALVKDEFYGRDYTELSDYDRFASQRSRSVTLIAGQRYYLEVLHKEGTGGAHVSVAWQPPGAARSIIPASVFTSDMPEGDDSDDDYLPAAWENEYGFNPTDNGITDARDGQYGDWDSDGLSNFAEFQLGTHPKNADTDGDTMSDKDERDFYHSDPLVSNLLNTTLHSTVALTGFTRTSVPWETRGDGSILAHERRGWTDYQFTVIPGEEGIYEARIIGGAEGGAVRSVESLPLSFHLDGEMLARQTMRCRLGLNTTLRQMTPWLNAGVHTLRIQNHNTRADCKLRLNSITLHRLGGADADSNGIPDWVEQKLASENALTRFPTTSRTSPACIEGVTSSLAALGISKSIAGPDGQPIPQPQEVMESVNQGFYGNIPLDPEAATALTVSFQNGARSENRAITWTATNILAQGALTLRKGDSLKLTAHGPDEPDAGSFTLTHNGQSVTSTGGSTTHDASQPFVIAFDTPGTHTLTATWTPPTGAPQTGTLIVTAREANFGPAFILQTYNRRTWTIPGVSGMDIEANDNIAWQETTTAGAASRSFVVASYETGTRYVIARLPTTGDIIARGSLESFTVANVGETADAQLVLIRPDGSRVYRFTLVAENLPPNAEVRLSTHFQGAIFSNGSRDLVLTASDFSSNGTADILIEWGDATPHRTCHTMRTYLVD